jgi:hypothetical protein
MSSRVRTKIAADVFRTLSGSFETVVTSMLPSCSRKRDWSCSVSVAGPREAGVAAAGNAPVTRQTAKAKSTWTQVIWPAKDPASLGIKASNGTLSSVGSSYGQNGCLPAK